MFTESKNENSIQNKPISDEIYEERKNKGFTKNWSSVYNQQQWANKNGNIKLNDEINYRTSEIYQTTEKIEASTKNQNTYRKMVIRRKPVERTKLDTKKTDFKYRTTEENVMTVTPETTTKHSILTTRRRFQKPYSSTTVFEKPETTTTSYTSKTKNKISTYEKEDNKQIKTVTETSYNPTFDQNKYVNIFVGTKQKVLRTNNSRFNKYQRKNEEKKQSTRYQNGESNVLSEDSEETQVPQETASIVDNNRYNNFNKGKTAYYENHKSEYSEIKDPQSYYEKNFNNIVPVTSQYVTTQAFNNGKVFVGSSIGTPIPSRKANYSNTAILNIGDHNRKTFKLSAVAFNTAQALNPFQTKETTYSDPKILSEKIAPTQELSTVAFNTVEPFVPISTESPKEEASKSTLELSTKPLDNPESFSTTPESKEEVLKLSIVSSNTAEAYQSLFNEDAKVPPSKPEIEATEQPPEVILLNTTPSITSTELPFTSKRLEEPTTTPEVENEVEFRFDQEYSTESPETTLKPTRPPQPPLKPRPFELLSTESSALGFPDKSEKLDDFYPYPFFRISTASPFSLPESVRENDNYLRVTDAPTTQPTNFYIKPEEFGVNEEETSESYRPGLVVPSSVSPQTLHTLAAYFENALSNMTSEERESLDLNYDIKGEEMEKKLKDLLSNMTRQKYEQLFKEKNPNSETENTTVKEVEGDTTVNPEDIQKSRKLAKLFSQALSEYLNDPTNFKNRLIQVRPTEPPSHNNIVNTEKELLSFSEDDSKGTLVSLYNSTWNFNTFNKTEVDAEQANNFIGDNEGLSIADSQSFISQFNNLNYEDKKKVSSDNLPKNHWTSSPHATNLWRTTFAVNPFSLNKDFLVTEAYVTTTNAPETEPTESYSDLDNSPLSSEDQEEIKYELRVFPKLSSNSSKLQGILIDFMNTSSTSEAERLHRILRKLNTTEDEFLDRMKKIEENPLTRRLILLLIHECEATKNEKEELIPFLNPQKEEKDISADHGSVRESIDEDQDARALQLLNSLYKIATKFGR